MTAATTVVAAPGMKLIPDARDDAQGTTWSGRIALAMPWCPWLPERSASMARLRDALGLGQGEGTWFRSFGEQLPNDQWSEQVFDWLAQKAEEGHDWCMQIQEDALVPANFWPVVHAIFEALPPQADIVGFHVVHPIAQAMVAEDVRIITTADALVGVCWAMRGATMRAFREWRRTQLADGWRAPVPPKGLPAITEDTMIGLFAMATGRRIWHPIPAIVDHDTSMKSVWGNDDHVNRRPCVTWRDSGRCGDAWDDRELESPNFWRGGRKRVQLLAEDGVTRLGTRVAYCTDPENRPWRDVGRYYDATPRLARRWVRGFGDAEKRRAELDTGAHEKRLLSYARRSRMTERPLRRVVIATPTRGTVDARYASRLMRAAQLMDVDVVDGLELFGAWQWQELLVTVRSRFVRAFLETDASHLWMLDADVLPDVEALVGMVRADRPFVACPYPRRAGVDFGAIRRAFEAGHAEESMPAEAVAYDYAVRWRAGGMTLDAQNCVEVEGVPLGCSLVTRELLERMVQYYGDADRDRVDLAAATAIARGTGSGSKKRVIEALVREVARWRAGHMGLSFTDVDEGGTLKPSVALFQTHVEERQDLEGDPRVLMHDDGGFCHRVRELGEKVWLYLGPGSPADHVGEHVYRGRVEAFGLQRVAKS